MATGTATVTVTVDNGGTTNNPTSQVFAVTVVQQLPTVDPIPNLTIYANSGAQTVPLTGIGSGLSGSYQAVTVWAYTSDPTIIPAPTVNYTSPNSTGSLTFTPVPGAVGTATVTVTVNNGPNNFSQVFTVSVVNPPPTLNPIQNVTVYENAGVQSVALSGIGSGSTNQNPTLTVSAVSSNPGIISAPLIKYVSPNNFGTLTFAPVTNAVGSATVTVTVNNGASNNRYLHAVIYGDCTASACGDSANIKSDCQCQRDRRRFFPEYHADGH